MSDDKDMDRWARLRFAVIGGLLAAPPERGELKGALLELSKRTWSHPNDGTAIQFGFSTLEHWFNQARKASDPVAALRRQRREDAGQTRCLSPQMIQEINAQYRKYTGWTIQLHHANLIALASEQSELGVPPSLLRYGTPLLQGAWLPPGSQAEASNARCSGSGRAIGEA